MRTLARLVMTSLCAIALPLVVQAQTQAVAELSMDPAAGTFIVGETITMRVRLDTKEIETDEVDLTLAYDKTLLEVIDADTIEDGTQITPGALYELPLENSVDITNGQIRFDQTSLKEVYATATGDPAGEVVAIAFRALAAGEATVSFVTDGLNPTQVITGRENVLGTSTGAAFTIIDGESSPAATAVNQILMNAEPFSIPADGASESTVSITVLDAEGSAVSGQGVTVQITQGDASLPIASGTTDANGQLLATLIASTTPGTQTVTATATGTDVFASLDVIQLATATDEPAPIATEPEPTIEPTEELPPILESAPDRLTSSGPATAHTVIAFAVITCLGMLAQIRASRYTSR